MLAQGREGLGGHDWTTLEAAVGDCSGSYVVYDEIFLTGRVVFFVLL